MTVDRTTLHRRPALALAPGPVRDPEPRTIKDDDVEWLKGGEPLDLGQEVAGLKEWRRSVDGILEEIRDEMKWLRRGMIALMIGLIGWGAMEIWSKRDFVAPTGAITSFAAQVFP